MERLDRLIAENENMCIEEASKKITDCYHLTSHWDLEKIGLELGAIHHSHETVADCWQY